MGLPLITPIGGGVGADAARGVWVRRDLASVYIGAAADVACGGDGGCGCGGVTRCERSTPVPDEGPKNSYYDMQILPIKQCRDSYITRNPTHATYAYPTHITHITHI